MSTTRARHFKSDPNKFVPFVLGLMSRYEFYRDEASERRRGVILILISPSNVNRPQPATPACRADLCLKVLTTTEACWRGGYSSVAKPGPCQILEFGI
jgi:hypothetical protein